MSVTVLVADDHPLVRRGMRSLLENEPGISVVGEAEDGLQVLQMAEKYRPEVVLVDMMMPNLNGLEAIKTLRQRFPRIHLIVVSMQSAEPYVVEALRAGATGYVLKDDAPGEVVHAIRQSLSGIRYLSPRLEDKIENVAIGPVRNPTADAYESLTPREREVLQMAAEGKTAAQIAAILSISTRTAELHRGRMMGKLGLRNQTELVRYAVRRGSLAVDM